MADLKGVIRREVEFVYAVKANAKLAGFSAEMLWIGADILVWEFPDIFKFGSFSNSEI